MAVPEKVRQTVSPASSRFPSASPEGDLEALLPSHITLARVLTVCQRSHAPLRSCNTAFRAWERITWLILKT